MSNASDLADRFEYAMLAELAKELGSLPEAEFAAALLLPITFPLVAEVIAELRHERLAERLLPQLRLELDKYPGSQIGVFAFLNEDGSFLRLGTAAILPELGTVEAFLAEFFRRSGKTRPFEVLGYVDVRTGKWQHRPVNYGVQLRSNDDA